MLTPRIRRGPKWDVSGSSRSAEEDLKVVEGGSAAEPSSTRLTPRIRNITVGTDLSVGGAAALTAAGELAGRAEAKLSVINVVEPPQCPDLQHSAEPGVAGWVDSLNRILVAVDLSRNSQAVLDTALMLAQCDGSEVRVVNSEEPWKSLWRRVTFRGQRALLRGDRDRFERLVQNSHFPEQPHAVVIDGRPGHAVLSEARKWDADLIVLGARRVTLPFLARLGRTARYVLRRGHRSIVLVPT